MRELGATVTFFDRSALEPGFALRCTVGVAIPLIVAAALGRPALGIAAAIGAFITGFTSLQGIYRTRLSAVLVAAVSMSAASFVGAIAAHSTPGVIAATAVAGYLCATFGQIGPIAATVGLNSLVAFVLFSSQPLAAPAALLQSELVAAGGAIQALLLLSAWPFARLETEREAVAGVYRDLAAYARAVADGTQGLPPITPFATARQVLADPQPFARAAEKARLQRLLEDAEVIRKRLGAAVSTREPTLPAAERLDEIATSLHRGGDAEWLSGFDLLSRPRPGPYVGNRIAWLSRDSLRFALVLAIAMALGRHFEADRGYWIPLTTAIVLKPDFLTTVVRGFGRIAGTLVGAVVASLATALLRGHAAAQVAGVIVAAAAAYVTFNPNYALFTIAITSFVVISLGMRGLPGTTTIAQRVLDTLAGGALAMIGYLALPTWERKRTRALLADLIDEQRALSSAIFRAYTDPSDDRYAAIERARTQVWKIRTAVEASIDRTRSEPYRHHTIGAGRALRILAATQRFGLANLALEAGLDDRTIAIDAKALRAFAGALDERMAELAQALREPRRARPDRRLEATLARLDGPLRDRAAAYADAVRRMTRLIGYA
ncbi:MAG TPA: FUSC family protein [Candidatus Binatia bacterium]|nr:FUSC family protein [Candidatus Binatia bacterium]